MPVLIVAAALWFTQAALPSDPHAGRYTRDLGVACSYCHEGGDWTRSPGAAFAMALNMARLTAELNAGAFSSRAAITCHTCHRGAPKPSQMDEAAWRAVSEDWPATATVASPNASRPAREVYRNLQVLGSLPAGTIRVAMSVIVASLGVNCEYCHAGDEWDSDNKPAKKTAREMMRIALPRDLAAGERLPIQCYVCHRGAIEPRSAPRDR